MVFNRAKLNQAPFFDKKNNSYKGYIQLAIRSGYYKS